ncbi:hypothetical protein LAG90_14560 [Marinilongibacter aquaticus]|uniref:DUF6134 family protein n=1 Tax=Marinilongibacter aquaticus TaxID=2975157 RepID=UPI0021BD9980|nr:DUF6134 family protein [Marinilongibacter aquaticus]UBM58026.1 hypothetical protein LAG90_14560 [Marinilongibacter aquaticus]
MRTTLSFLFFFALYPLSAQQVETRIYAVKVVGLRVGKITATKTIWPDSVSYSLFSKVDANFLVYKLKVDYRVKSTLDKEGLLHSEVKVVSNKGNYITRTQKIKDGRYKVESVQHEGTKNREFEAKIKHTFTSIFFNEPEGLEPVLAEYYADFIELSPLEAHAYKGVLDKNIDEYYYEKGRMVKSVKKNPITDLVIEYMDKKGN